MFTLLRRVKTKIYSLLGYCEMCQRFFVYPKRRRMNTAYQDEESNYVYVCENCFKSNEQYWEERSQEYWSERL